jgi:DNA (cytosine-5)-methyltransferase 1
MTTTLGHDTEIKAVDVFCGVGGLTHGLVQGGIRVVAGVDVDDACKFPYETNNPAIFLANDVNTLSGRSIAKLLRGAQLTLLAGCAPCQPFSTYSQSGRKQKGSSDWSLVASFGKLVRKVGPDFITMEMPPTFDRGYISQRLRAYGVGRAIADDHDPVLWIRQRQIWASGARPSN